MKKVVALILVVILAFTAFAGCGPKETEQVGMTFSNWSGAEDSSKAVIAQMIEDFNKSAGENDKITQINWPWGDTEVQLALRAQGTEQFDVAQIDIRMLPALAKAGVLADLTPIFGEKYFTDNFSEGSIKVGNYNGVQYGVPWTVAPMAMIANPKILKDSGVDFDIVTIADFEKACEMVKTNHPQNKDADKGNDIIPYAAMTKDAGTAAPDYMVWMWTFGANVFDKDGNPTVDSANAVKCLEWFKSLKDKGYIQDAMDRGGARTLYKEQRVAFYDDALMSKGAIYNEKAGTIEEQAKPMVRPVLTAGDKPQASGWGHLLVIINRSPKKEEAKAFIENLLSKDVALNYFDVTGNLPSKNSVLAESKVTSDYWTKSWTPVLAGGRLAETAGPKYSAYNQVMLDQIQAVLSGTKTPSEGAKAMKTALANA